MPLSARAARADPTNMMESLLQQFNDVFKTPVVYHQQGHVIITSTYSLGPP
jgi:hypothetical protein